MCFESVAVSIHAPHAGRDRAMYVAAWMGDTFQSTRPMRGATEITAIIGEE